MLRTPYISIAFHDCQLCFFTSNIPLQTFVVYPHKIASHTLKCSIIENDLEVLWIFCGFLELFNICRSWCSRIEIYNARITHQGSNNLWEFTKIPILFSSSKRHLHTRSNSNPTLILVQTSNNLQWIDAKEGLIITNF